MDGYTNDRGKADWEIATTVKSVAEEWDVEEFWCHLLSKECFAADSDSIGNDKDFYAHNSAHFDVIFAIEVAKVLSEGFSCCDALEFSCFVFVSVKT